MRTYEHGWGVAGVADEVTHQDLRPAHPRLKLATATTAFALVDENDEEIEQRFQNIVVGLSDRMLPDLTDFNVDSILPDMHLKALHEVPGAGKAVRHLMQSQLGEIKKQLAVMPALAMRMYQGQAPMPNGGGDGGAAASTAGAPDASAPKVPRPPGAASLPPASNFVLPSELTQKGPLDATTSVTLPPDIVALLGSSPHVQRLAAEETNSQNCARSLLPMRSKQLLIRAQCRGTQLENQDGVRLLRRMLGVRFL